MTNLALIRHGDPKVILKHTYTHNATVHPSFSFDICLSTVGTNSESDSENWRHFLVPLLFILFAHFNYSTGFFQGNSANHASTIGRDLKLASPNT